MPIYEFQCRRCDHAFEALVDAGEQAVCPACAAADLERRLSVPARPKVAAGPIKTACSAAPGTPPCGPTCGRWPG